MEKIKNKSIDKDHSLLDEINRQLRDIKNYSEWIDECVDVIKNCLNEMKEKKMSFNSKSTYESSLDRLNIKNSKMFEYDFQGHDKILLPLVIEHYIYNKETENWEENQEWVDSDGLEKTATQIIKEDPKREIAWYLIEDYLQEALTLAFGKEKMKNVVINIREKK